MSVLEQGHQFIHLIGRWWHHPRVWASLARWLWAHDRAAVIGALLALVLVLIALRFGWQALLRALARIRTVRP